MKNVHYLNNIQLKAELDRCLGCATKPCKEACPVKCDPQYFIKKAKENNFSEATKSIYKQNPLGKICGFICPERLCMKACIRSKIDFPIRIPQIQATIIEKSPTKNHITVPPTTHEFNIAIIGSGPAGIGAAITLAQHGFKSTIFEKADKIGGDINLIPKNRLPHKVLTEEFSSFVNLKQITFQLNSKIKTPTNLLTKGFSAVIVATGEDTPHYLDIKGENYCISYQDFLSQTHLYKGLNKIAIIGGGNVAADCALTAKELGITSIEIYVRRRSCDMRLTQEEYLNLIQAQININPLFSPIEIVKEKSKLSLKLLQNEIKDNKAVPLKNETYTHKNFDAIIRATGSKTSIQHFDEKIFYAGDCKNNSSSVVEALADGQNTALALINTLLK